MSAEPSQAASHGPAPWGGQQSGGVLHHDCATSHGQGGGSCHHCSQKSKTAGECRLVDYSDGTHASSFFLMLDKAIINLKKLSTFTELTVRV